MGSSQVGAVQRSWARVDGGGRPQTQRLRSTTAIATTNKTKQNERLLGEGVEGEVWLARHKETREAVAIKLV